MYNGDTPIIAAVRYANIAAVKVLIDYGANMEKQKIGTGDTVLHFAARFADSELMNMLVSQNPSTKFINMTNMAGMLPTLVSFHTNTSYCVLWDIATQPPKCCKIYKGISLSCQPLYY